MNLNKDIPERNRIMYGVFNESETMTETDVAYHRQVVSEAFKCLLHERSVIDDCVQRFKKTFDEQRFVYVGALVDNETTAKHIWSDAGMDWLKGLSKRVLKDNT